MDIYFDYANWKFENHEFISKLVKNKSKTISRFASVIAVVDYLYDKYVEEKSLSDDEEVIFSTGFDYIYDKFHLLKTILEFKFNNDLNELEKFSDTINMLFYINDFQAEALEYENLDIDKLDSLEDKVNTCLDNKENAPEEYLYLLNKATTEIFEDKDIHTVDQIFYEIALEYGIYEENDFELYNEFINKQIEKNKMNNSLK